MDILVRDAQCALRATLDVPDRPAGFYHDYFCPEHGVELAFDEASPGSHRCPKGLEQLAGEPFDSAWRWFVNNRLSTQAFHLGLVWRLLNDERCLDRCRAILLDYAAVYPRHERSPDRGHGRGRATYQSLDECVWLIPLVRAYDLVRERLSQSERVRIEGDLIRPAALHILSEKYNRIHNIECWHNAALAAAGVCLDDEDLVDTAVHADFGFRHQLAEGVRADGLWW